MRALEQNLSYCHGSELKFAKDDPYSLSDLLSQIAYKYPFKRIIYIDTTGKEIQQTYKELLEEASSILTGLHNIGCKPNDKIIFQFSTKRDFIPAFWACILGGFIPVPLSIAPTYQDKNSSTLKLYNTWQALDEPYIFISQDLLQSLNEFSEVFQINKLNIVDINAVRNNQATDNFYPVKPDDLALMLLTSGSTSLPKMVMQSHRALISRSAASAQFNNFHAKDVSVNWFPLEHVGGLVMFHLQSIYTGCEQIEVAVELVLKNPLVWLDLIHKYHATITWAPNFAYGLVNDYLVKAKELYTWDLSSMRFILNGGEAIVAKQARKFLQLLAPYGLSMNAMFPAWGMSETCSGVTFSQKFFDISSDDDQYTAVGRPIPGFTFRITNESGEIVNEGIIGRLEAKGPSVTSGYYKNPTANLESFTEDGWFITGDLGIVRNGNLFITGRQKDIIIINGLNFYCHEIEAVVEEMQGIELSYTAAVAIREINDVTDKLAIFFVPKNMNKQKIVQQISVIHSVILQEFNLNPSYIIPVHKEDIPKTDIGKIQRAQLKQRFEHKMFDNLVKEYCNTSIDSEMLLNQEDHIQLAEKMLRIWQEIFRLDCITINDDFFKLGGNSILALQLVHKMNEHLAQNIPVSAIFKYKTIGSLVLFVTQHLQTAIKIEKWQHNYAPLSFAQKRLWFIERYEQGSNAYHVPIIFELISTINLYAFKQSLQAIFERHEILRTVFKQDENDETYQYVLKEPLAIKEVTLSKKAFIFRLKEDVNKTFDLTRDYPIRINIYNLSSQQYVLINVHHVAFDGWSADIFLNELRAYYHYFDQKLPLNLPKLSIQYKDFAYWQRNYLQGEHLKQQLQYWCENLENYEPLTLPLDKPRPSQFDYRGAYFTFTLSKTLSLALRTLAQANSTTLYTILLTGFYVLLNKYSDQEDLVIGTPIANRHYSQIEHLLGFFVNTLVLRTKLSGDLTLAKLIMQTHQQLIEAQTHQDLPFEYLVNLLQIEKDPSRHPIFQVMFQVMDFNFKKIDQQLPFKWIDSEDYYPIAKWDLYLSVDNSEETLKCTFEYATSLFEYQTIARLAKHYTAILEQLIQDVQQPIKYVSLLSPEEYDLILYRWNDNTKDYPHNKTIIQLFEEQVRLTPNNIAVVYQDQKLTYQMLNEKANQLANYISSQYITIKKQKLMVNQLITFCSERDLDLIISTLAIIKLGSAYVPIDTAYPPERISGILKDTQSSILLTQPHMIEKLVSIVPTDVHIIAIDKKIYELEDKNNLANLSHPCDLAYVIYTSGTTGQPKGVMIEQRSIISLVKNSGYITIQAEDAFLQLANPVFDATTFEIWGALLNGAKLVIPHNYFDILADACRFESFLIQHKITSLFITTALFNNLYQANNSVFNELKYLLVGGEAQNPFLIKRLCNQSQRPTYILNAYGPTEVTTFSTYYICRGDEISTIPIGHSFHNRKAYVLDKYLQPLPIGAIGELYLGGSGIARGYLNKPELTKERFIDNPFLSKEDEEQGYTRLYKTGDLVRWLPDGNIEYIGRNDQQVKLRGYRIELGEIEQELVKHSAIKQAIVLLKEQAENKYLVAYYVADNVVEAYDLHKHLGQRVPEYMIPSLFIRLTELPLTANGKLDPKKLPEPNFNLEIKYVAPRNKMEADLCQIWQEVLDIKQIGIEDDFFKLGGNSILALKVTNKINKYLRQNIPISDIFKYKTIARLSVCELKHSEQPIINKHFANNAPLSFAQSRLWFIEQYEQNTNAYHVPLIFKLETTINLSAFKQSLKSIVERHEILRTVINQDEKGEGFQCVLNEPLEINELLISEANFESRLVQDINTIFDLNRSYPIRVIIYRIESKHYALINIHHVAFDGWSVDIFLKELKAYYHYYDQQIPLTLPTISVQYKDFACWQRRYLQGELLERQLQYWCDSLEGYEPLALPLDKPRPSQFNYHGDRLTFTLELKLSNELRALARTNSTTLYTVLLAGFYVLLNKYSNQEDIVIGTPIANRHYSQIENLIGFFVNTLAVRIKLLGKQTLAQLITQTHQKLINAQAYQDLPFEHLVSFLQVEKDPSRHPIFQVIFQVLNFNSKQISKQMPFKWIDSEDYYSVAKFDLSLIIDDMSEEINFSINYATNLFERSTIFNLGQRYLFILEKFVENLEATINEVNILLPGEHNLIVFDWNKTDSDYVNNKTIHQLFEEQVEIVPDNIALIYEDKRLTYREINERANQLAFYLKGQQYIWPDTLIVLCMDRSEQMLICILSILKAGAAYVPIDPNYPDARIEYILKDTQAKIILTNKKYKNKLENFAKKNAYEKPITLLAVDSIEMQSQLLHQPTRNFLSDVTYTNLAYVIYTSGTTGRPKGVMIEHKAYLATIDCVKNLYFESQQKIKTYSVTNYVFDIFGLEYGLPLLSGGLIYIGNKEFKHLDCSNYDFIQMTPSLCDLKLECLYNTDNIKLFIGGEKLNTNLLNKLLTKSINVINFYGPTETTIWSTSKLYSYKKDNNICNVSLGKPFANEKIYVLDSDLKPLPIGIIGELYIGGIGLARGYLNQAKLTEEKFIANPFQTKEEKKHDKNTKLYKTGDLVRWMSDGSLEYIGRNDCQVKIRGYRIELEEIESILCSYNGVKQSVVLTKEQKNDSENKYLIGYYVSETKMDEKDMINYLYSKLPEYMVPNILVHLETLPLTFNGKIDKKALMIPEITNDQEYVAPRNELEAQICQIWAEILALRADKISIQEDFFKLGGDSITSVKFVSRLRKELNIDISIKDIFNYRTIEKLGDCVLQQTRNNKLLQEQEILSNIIGYTMNDFDDFEPFVIFNELVEGKSNTLFLFPPGEGGGESYFNNIVPGLYDKKLVIFNNYYLYLCNKFGLDYIEYMTYESLASNYISYIKSIQPEGPYNLFGWSFGGVLAFEITRQLINMGEKVKNVFLVDSFFDFKQVLMKIDTNLTANNINCKYNPLLESNIIDTKITLFKATKKVEQNVISNGQDKFMIENKYKLYQYYAENTEYNHLDKLVITEKINVIPMEHGHYSWILDKYQIEMICTTIRKMLSFIPETATTW